MVLTEDRNPEDTEEDTTSGSSKDACRSSVWSACEDGINTMLKVSNNLVQKKSNLNTWMKMESGLVLKPYP